MIKKTHLIFTALAILLILSSCATISSGEMPGTVKRYLDEHGTDCGQYALSDTSALNDYRYVEQSYDVYGNIETVWRDYRQSSPVRAFTSPIIDFGVVYSPEDAAIRNAEDPGKSPFAEGQVYLLNLKYMKLYNFPVGFKVNKIDSDKKMIEFIYLKNNIANGFQRIFLDQDYDSQGRAVTHVKHISFYNNKQFFIERFIYPSFHKRTINDFHENVFEMNSLDWQL